MSLAFCALLATSVWAETALPDLTATLSSLNKTVAPGASVSFDVTTQNIGTGDATNEFDTVLFLGDNPDFPWGGIPDDAEIAEAEFPSGLSAGADRTDTLSFTAPSTPGIYYVIAKADDFDGVWNESDENNNWSKRGTLYVGDVYAPANIEGRTATVTEEDDDINTYAFSVYTVIVTENYDDTTSVSTNTYSYYRTDLDAATIVLGNNGGPVSSISLKFESSTAGTAEIPTIEGIETNAFTLGAAPTWSISPSSAQHGGGSDSDDFLITQETGAPATWTATTSEDWIYIFHGHETGIETGKVAYAVYANTTGVSRAGTIMAGGNSFTVNQAVIQNYAPTNFSQLVLSIDEGYETKKYAFYYEHTNDVFENKFASVEVTDNNGDVEFDGMGSWFYFLRNGEHGVMTLNDGSPDAVTWELIFTSKTEGYVTGTHLPFTLTSGDWAPECLEGKMAVDGFGATSFREEGSFVQAEEGYDDDYGTYTYTNTSAITGLATQWYEGEPTNEMETVELTMFSATQGVYVATEGEEDPETGIFTLEDGALYWLEVEGGDGTGAYAQNETVEIEACNSPSEVFNVWTGDVAYVESVGDAETTVTMPADDITVWATHTDTPWDVSGSLEVDVGGEAVSNYPGVFVYETNPNPTNATTATWSATIEPGEATNWLSLDAVYEGMTNMGSVLFSVKANETGRCREGVILVAGKEVDVDQAPLMPVAAMNPSPSNGDGNADRNVTLQWENGGRTLSYNVYFAQSSDPSDLRFAASFAPSAEVVGATNTYAIGTRAPGRRCTWRVDSVNEAGTNAGTVWQFMPKDEATVDESLNAGGLNLDWTTDTNVAPWFSQSIVTNHDDSAMQSGAITNGQETAIETTIEGPGTLSFDVKVLTDGTNSLNFEVNGTALTNWVGDTNWTTRTAELEKGEQVVKWVYAQSNDNTNDAAWLDAVSWEGENKTTYPINCGSAVHTAAYLWSDDDQNWLELGVELGRDEIVLENLQQGNWYWFCVLEYIGTEWVLVHGDWFRQLDD